MPLGMNPLPLHWKLRYPFWKGNATNFDCFQQTCVPLPIYLQFGWHIYHCQIIKIGRVIFYWSLTPPPPPLLCHPSLIFLDLFPSPSSTVPPPPPSFSLLGISFPLYTLQPSPSSSLLCEFPSPFIHNILTPPSSSLLSALSLFPIFLPHLIFHNYLLIASPFAHCPSSPLSLSLSLSFYLQKFILIISFPINIFFILNSGCKF